VKNSKSL